MSRIALCLSGKIGNIKGKSGYYKSNPEVLLKGYELYKRHIIDKNNVTQCIDVVIVIIHIEQILYVFDENMYS